jgi:hypothetical protein
VDSYRLLVWVHIVLAVVSIGLALFWFIMRFALRRGDTAGVAQTLLETANAARWPHVAVPWKLRLPLPLMQWLVLALLAASGFLLLQARGGAPDSVWWLVKLGAVALMVLLLIPATQKPRQGLIGLAMLAVLVAALSSALSFRGVAGFGGLTLYHLCVVLHLTALGLWLGHMFVWALITGPALKRIQPANTAELLREKSLQRGGLGWPALAVLIPTGLYLLSVRGIMPMDLLTGAAYAGTQGVVLAVKLACVLIMIGYQASFGHRPAPIAIYFDMLAAVTIIGASVLLVRGFV